MCDKWHVSIHDILEVPLQIRILFLLVLPSVRRQFRRNRIILCKYSRLRSRFLSPFSPRTLALEEHRDTCQVHLATTHGAQIQDRHKKLVRDKKKQHTAPMTATSTARFFVIGKERQSPPHPHLVRGSSPPMICDKEDAYIGAAASFCVPQQCCSCMSNFHSPPPSLRR